MRGSVFLSLFLCISIYIHIERDIYILYLYLYIIPYPTTPPQQSNPQFPHPTPLFEFQTEQPTNQPTNQLASSQPRNYPPNLQMSKCANLKLYIHTPIPIPVNFL